MSTFTKRIRSWCHENKLMGALFVGVLFLTGTPFWWEPARSGFRASWQWALTPHGVSGWVLLLVAPVVLGIYGRGALRLWRGWRPSPAPSPAPGKVTKQTQAEPVVEVLEGVQWRCNLFGGKVDRLSAHCPKCFYKIDPKDHQGFRNNETAYICDGCREFKVQIPGNPFTVEDRVTRLIEAAWLRRQEAGTISRR